MKSSDIYEIVIFISLTKIFWSFQKIQFKIVLEFDLLPTAAIDKLPQT